MRDFEYETFREDKKHTEVAFPYNTYLCSIPLDFSSVPVHWHEEMEFIVVKKGRGLVTLDRESRLLEAGQAVIVLPGQLHGIRQYQQERMEYENIIFRLEMLLPKEGDVCGPKFLEPYRDGKLLYPAWIDGSALYHEEMLECIRKMDELSEQRPRGYPLAVKGWLFQFFFLGLCGFPGNCVFLYWVVLCIMFVDQIQQILHWWIILWFRFLQILLQHLLQFFYNATILPN